MEEQVRLGNRDKGWNDPPNKTFAPGPQAQSSPRRNLLNQRVAMPQNYPSPLRGQGQAKAQPPLSGGPPPLILSHTSPPPPSAQPQQGTLPPPPQGVCSAVPSADGHTTQGNAVSGSPSDGGDGSGDSAPGGGVVTCKSTLALLRGVLDLCRSSLQKRVIADIEKRLQVLESSWQTAKLSSPVQQRTAKLAADLAARSYDAAHEAHLSLMMHHVSEVSQWMVGVKRLIHEAKQALPMGDNNAPSEEAKDGTMANIYIPGSVPAPDQEQPSPNKPNQGNVNVDDNVSGGAAKSSGPGDGEPKEGERTESEMKEEGENNGEAAVTEEEEEDIAKKVEQIDLTHS